MKLITHDIFAFGLCAFTLTRFVGLGEAVVVAFVLSIVINRIIDGGHIMRHGRPTRSYVTHSILTAPIWGAVAGGIIIPGGYLMLRSFLQPAPIVSLTIISALTGVVVAYAHLLLDSVTEGGVFFWKRRIALAHWRYNNAGANGLAIVAGVALLLLGIA